MTVYWEGDVPAEDLLLSPARAPEDYIDLEPFTDVDLQLRAPDGTIIEAAGDLLGSIVDDTVVIEWPGASPFTEGSGIYELSITLLGSGDISQRIAPERLIVQGDDGWYSLEEARADWAGAPDDDALLYQLLSTARRDVVEYDAGNKLTDETVRPSIAFRDAQLMQARNAHNAALVAPAGDAGEGAYTLTPFPLDWKVKQLIRPKSGVPVIG